MSEEQKEIELLREEKKRLEEDIDKLVIENRELKRLKDLKDDKIENINENVEGNVEGNVKGKEQLKWGQSCQGWEKY